MTYPQQMPGYPAPPAQGYPAQQPGFPVPPPVYAPQAPPQYAPPQQYQQQAYAPQQPAPQLAAGSLDAFYTQPAVGGGAALKFKVGTTHVLVVSRKMTDADVQQQTQPNTGIPATYRDGRPKFVMKVPARVAVSQEHTDGTAQWYVAGATRDVLAQAMRAAGAPEGPPQSRAVIVVTKTGERPIPGFSPAGVFSVQYVVPGPQADQYAQQLGISLEGITPDDGTPAGAGPVSPPAAPPAPPAAPAPVAQVPQPGPIAAMPQQFAARAEQVMAQLPQQPAPMAYQQPAPAPQPAPAAPAAPAAQLPPPPAAQPGTAQLDPDKAALLAKLTGQPAPVAS